MTEIGLLKGWQDVVSTIKNPEGGWLIQTPTVQGAHWDGNAIPTDPRMAFLKRTRDGEYVVRGIYDADGFVHTCREKESVALP